MSTSPIPAALDAIVAAVKGACPAAEVCDGSPVNTDADLVVVGYSSTPTTEAVTFTVTDADTGRAQPLEVFDVTCEASSWRGGTNLSAVRVNAFAMVDAITAAIDVDPTLGRAIRGRATVSSGHLVQDPTTKGAVATVQFYVHVEAFRRP
jgi:hypothetical protein